MTNEIKIDWLDECSHCASKIVSVISERTDGKFNELDDVKCKCGNTGYIDVDGDAAFVCWDNLTLDEIRYNELKFRYNELKFRYNELKFRYDEAIKCLMESNYSDVKYLRARGVIE